MTQAILNTQALEVINNEKWHKLPLDIRIDFLFDIERDVATFSKALTTIKNLLGIQ